MNKTGYISNERDVGVVNDIPLMSVTQFIHAYKKSSHHLSVIPIDNRLNRSGNFDTNLYKTHPNLQFMGQNKTDPNQLYGIVINLNKKNGNSWNTYDSIIYLNTWRIVSHVLGFSQKQITEIQNQIQKSTRTANYQTSDVVMAISQNNNLIQVRFCRRFINANATSVQTQEHAKTNQDRQ